MMSLADRRSWRSARTLTDLGQLMAAWLEGRIGSRPGYASRCGPDPETTGLTGTLAAACRSGYITESSQPGIPAEAGFDGAAWRQRAAVGGLVGDQRLAGLLREQAETAGLTVIVHHTTRPTTSPARGMTVTERNGRPYTAFGARLDRADLATNWSGIHRAAMRQVTDAWQITVVDPDWGRNDRLWPLLDNITHTTSPADRNCA